MSEDLIKKMLAQMTPEQESLGILRDIKSLLERIASAPRCAADNTRPPGTTAINKGHPSK